MKKLLLKVTSGPKYSFSVVKERCVRFYDELHYHPEFELTLIIQGRGTRFVGDHIGSFNDGDLVFIGSRLPHVWRSEVKDTGGKRLSVSIAIHFEKKFMGEDFFNKPEMQSIKRMLDSAGRGLQITGKTRTEVSACMVKMPDQNQVERLISLLQILNLISNSKRVKSLSSTDFGEVLLSDHSARIQAVYKYVIDNFKRPVSLEEIADAANMSATSFCRYFKKSTRKTFSKFLNEVRINYACRLLQESEKKIAEVCYESGFTNLSNFNKQFKSVTNCTPSEFLRLNHVSLRSNPKQT